MCSILLDLNTCSGSHLKWYLFRPTLFITRLRMKFRIFHFSFHSSKVLIWLINCISKCFHRKLIPFYEEIKIVKSRRERGKQKEIKKNKKGKRCIMLVRPTLDIRITMNKNDAFEFPCIIFINCDGNTNTQHLDEIN